MVWEQQHGKQGRSLCCLLGWFKYTNPQSLQLQNELQPAETLDS